MGVIKVLMCGGRRIGKTSIMAAIQQNVQDNFPSGDIVLKMEQSNSLIMYRKEQEKLFGPEYEEMTFIADTVGTTERSDYMCRVYLKDKKSNLELRFTDIPGEWFIDQTHHDELIELIRESQVLVIAVDSPHLVEKGGRYHEVYNRAGILTEEIMKAFQGNKEQRMVLFAPLKCERYRNRNRMNELLREIKSGYADLITYLCESDMSHWYTVAVTPVVTMGGVEFLRFTKPVDANGQVICDASGNELEAVSVNPATGYLEMNWPAEYLLLTDADGDHFYEPEDCDQPLIYIL